MTLHVCKHSNFESAVQCTVIFVNFYNFFNNDVIISSLLEKVISIYQNSRSIRQTAMVSVWPISKLSTESVGSRRELVANSCIHTADADATRQNSFVASALCIGHYFGELWSTKRYRGGALLIGYAAKPQQSPNYMRALLCQQEQQRVAVVPGNAQFISIRQVSSDVTVVWHAAAAAAADKTYCITQFPD